MNIKFIDLYNKCIQDKIPIVRQNTIDFIIKLIKENEFKDVLEIGTAYGYSTQLIASVDCVNSITTIEKSINNFETAKQYNESKKIEFINIDCFDFKTNKKYDFIFIDGPKSNQENLILSLLNNLKNNGIIIIDNLKLLNVRQKENKTKDNIKLLEKIDKLNDFLNTQNTFNYKFIDIDDGIGVITKNGTTKR